MAFLSGEIKNLDDEDGKDGEDAAPGNLIAAAGREGKEGFVESKRKEERGIGVSDTLPDDDDAASVSVREFMGTPPTSTSG